MLAEMYPEKALRKLQYRELMEIGATICVSMECRKCDARPVADLWGRKVAERGCNYPVKR